MTLDNNDDRYDLINDLNNLENCPVKDHVEYKKGCMIPHPECELMDEISNNNKYFLILYIGVCASNKDYEEIKKIIDKNLKFFEEINRLTGSRSIIIFYNDKKDINKSLLELSKLGYY